MKTFIHNIERAIDRYNEGDYDSALMHAVIAVNTACGNWKGIAKTGRSDYKKFIRNYDWLIERFGSLEAHSIRTQQMVVIKNEHGKIVGNPNPDVADIIYHIFRCNVCHGSEVPILQTPSSSLH